MKIARTFCLSITAMLLVAGCGSGIDRVPAESANQITLTTQTRGEAVVQGTHDEAVAAARHFLAAFNLGYADRILVVGGTRKQRDRLADAMAGPARRIMVATRTQANDPLRILVVRTIATPPTCGDWSDPPTQDFSNLPPRNYGCADQSNLARMVADPGDLESGRAAREWDSQRFAVTSNAYRNDNIVITTVTGSGQSSGGSE